MSSTKSSLSVPASSPRVFMDAYSLYKSKNLTNIPQLKYLANQDLDTIWKGILPGKKQKWIRLEDEHWIFHMKFFVLPAKIAPNNNTRFSKKKQVDNSDDDRFLLLLAENCLTDIVEILRSVRCNEISIDAIRHSGIAATLKKLRLEYIIIQLFVVMSNDDANGNLLAQCVQESQHLKEICVVLQKAFNDMDRVVRRLELEFKGADEGYPQDPWGLRSKLKGEVLRLLIEDTELARRLNYLDQSNLKNERQFQQCVQIVDDMVRECRAYIRTQAGYEQSFQDIKLQMLELSAKIEKNGMTINILTQNQKELQAAQNRNTEQYKTMVQVLQKKLNVEDMFTMQESFKDHYLSLMEWQDFGQNLKNEILCQIMQKADVNELRDVKAHLEEIERRQEYLTEKEVLKHLKDVVANCFQVQYVAKSDLESLGHHMEQNLAELVGKELENQVDLIKRSCAKMVLESKTVVDKEFTKHTDVIRQLQKRQMDLLDYMRSIDQNQIGKTQLSHYDTQINILKAHSMEQERQNHNFREQMNEIWVKQTQEVTTLRDHISLISSKHQNDIIVTLREEVDEIQAHLRQGTIPNKSGNDSNRQSTKMFTSPPRPMKHSNHLSKVAVPEEMANYTQHLNEELTELRSRIDTKAEKNEVSQQLEQKIGSKTLSMSLGYIETIRKQLQTIMIVMHNFLKSQSLEKNQVYIKELQQIQLWCASISIHRGQSQQKVTHERQLEKLLKDSELNGRLIERGINNMQLEQRDHRVQRESFSVTTDIRARTNQTTSNFYDTQNYQLHQRANQNAKIFVKHNQTVGARKLIPLSVEQSPRSPNSSIHIDNSQHLK